MPKANQTLASTWLHTESKQAGAVIAALPCTKIFNQLQSTAFIAIVQIVLVSAIIHLPVRWTDGHRQIVDA